MNYKYLLIIICVCLVVFKSEATVSDSYEIQNPERIYLTSKKETIVDILLKIINTHNSFKSFTIEKTVSAKAKYIFSDTLFKRGYTKSYIKWKMVLVTGGFYCCGLLGSGMSKSFCQRVYEKLDNFHPTFFYLSKSSSFMKGGKASDDIILVDLTKNFFVVYTRTDRQISVSDVIIKPTYMERFYYSNK